MWPSDSKSASSRCLVTARMEIQTGSGAWSMHVQKVLATEESSIDHMSHAGSSELIEGMGPSFRMELPKGRVGAGPARFLKMPSKPRVKLSKTGSISLWIMEGL